MVWYRGLVGLGLVPVGGFGCGAGFVLVLVVVVFGFRLVLLGFWVWFRSILITVGIGWLFLGGSVVFNGARFGWVGFCSVSLTFKSMVWFLRFGFSSPPPGTGWY